MLTPEQVKTLKQGREAHAAAETRRVEAVRALPDALRPIAFALFHRDPDGKNYNTYRRIDPGVAATAYREALIQLDALSVAERTTIFAAFFPSLVQAVESGWQFHRALPYQGMSGYPDGRQFFRAPNRPDVTLAARGLWLGRLMSLLGPEDALVWLAQHAAYLDQYGGSVSLLFAAAIAHDPEQGPAVFETLTRVARGDDPIGMFGRYIPQALLAAPRPDGWEVVARLLLSAQREEGVRQTILDALNNAQPAAFARILTVIRDENLVRFSAITRAVNSWTGGAWDSDQAPQVNRALGQLLTILEDSSARQVALAEGNGETVALALWANASADIDVALPLAESLLTDEDVAHRYAAVRFLASASLPEALPLLARALDDADLRVVAQAVSGLNMGEARLDEMQTNLGDEDRQRMRRAMNGIFAQLEALLARLPQRAASSEPTPLFRGALVPPLDRERVTDLLITYLGDRDPQELVAYMGNMSQYGRAHVARALAKQGVASPETRALIFTMLKDRASYPRQLSAPASLQPSARSGNYCR